MNINDVKEFLTNCNDAKVLDDIKWFASRLCREQEAKDLQEQLDKFPVGTPVTFTIYQGCIEYKGVVTGHGLDTVTIESDSVIYAIRPHNVTVLELS